MKQKNDRDYYQIILSRDARFDGKFFVGVTSTGIFCRPICPAPKPKFEHCLFFTTAYEAQEFGLRPCLRCRPESSPHLGAWQGTSNSVSRALKLIEEGALDGDGATVEILADRVGIGERHLRRLFQEHIGVAPLKIAQLRRILFAKKLLNETNLTMSSIAYASGFSSLRRFNESIKNLYGKTPSELRRKEKAGNINSIPDINQKLQLSLSYSPPFRWKEFLSFIKSRALTGIERVTETHYKRVLQYQEHTVLISIRNNSLKNTLQINITTSSVKVLPLLVKKIQNVFDLSADILKIETTLSHDSYLKKIIQNQSGLRIPGGWSLFETGVRAILGQQISLEAARNLGGQLIELCGASNTLSSDLPKLFPTPEHVLSTNLSSMKMTNKRKDYLKYWSEAILNPQLNKAIRYSKDPIPHLKEIKGIGDWTAHYIALRALRIPHAFPSSDIGLLRALEKEFNGRPSKEELEKLSQNWFPWRNYAAQHLWTFDSKKLKH